MSAPAITVILPVFNRTASLRRALASVLRQTMEDFECIVVDDASTLETREMPECIAESLGDPRLRVLSRGENGGPAAARVTAMQAMKGRYALLLDSDWELYPWALQRACHYLNDFAEIDMVCGLHVRDSDSRLFVRVREAPRVVAPEESREEPRVPDRIVAVRRCVIDEWLEKSHDYFALESHLFLTAKLGHSSLYVDEPWTLYRDGSADRVTIAYDTTRGLDDYVRFLREHGDLIATGGPCVGLDEILMDAYFALRRARRYEAQEAAEALRLRGIRPRPALLRVGLARVRSKVIGDEPSSTTWV